MNRYMCNVLDEMRKCMETRNFSYLPGLIEEVQVMGNRMEAAIEDKRDAAYYASKCKEHEETRDKLLAEIVALKQTKKELEG